MDDDEHVIAHRRERERRARSTPTARLAGRPTANRLSAGAERDEHADDEVEAEQQEADRQRQQQPGEEGIAAEQRDVLQPVGAEPGAPGGIAS